MVELDSPPKTPAYLELQDEARILRRRALRHHVVRSLRTHDDTTADVRWSLSAIRVRGRRALEARSHLVSCVMSSDQVFTEAQPLFAPRGYPPLMSPPFNGAPHSIPWFP